jgi:hypothetical protein
MRDWTKKYILEGREIIEVDDLLEWAEFFESSNRQIGLDYNADKTVRVSTVFLGIDHGFMMGDGPPILFETMIFGGENDLEMWRYATYDEAEDGHNRACELALGRSTVLNWEYLDAEDAEIIEEFPIPQDKL